MGGGIYAQDSKRKQDRHEAEQSGKIMAQTHVEPGYQLVELPLAGIDARAGFGADHLRRA